MLGRVTEPHPRSAQASTDGKNYADIPLMRQIAGKVIETPLSEYRYIRWNIRLLPAKKICLCIVKYDS